MANGASDEVRQQLLRTVEMFEAITEAQPDDFQSLEILKEAYGKLGRPADKLRASKQLISAYEKQGQLSQALLECESLAQEHRGDPELQTTYQRLQQAVASPGGTDRVTPPPGAGATPAAAAVPALAGPHRWEDGDRLLATMLVAEKLATPKALEPLLQKLAGMRANAAQQSEPVSLVQLMVNEQMAKLDDALGMLLDKSALPYLPLATYDVDRDAATLLPLEFALQGCLVPFDVVSRSVLVATCNPFDPALRQQVEARLGKRAFWYVSPPLEILATIRTAHGVTGAKPGGGAA